MDKNCIACGMPMKNPDDFAVGDVNKNYCKFCCREDGSMQSYEEKLESMTHFISETKNIDHASAKNKAKNIMSNLAAWNDKQ